MPRLTAETARARRLEIMEATLRAAAAKGLAHTSIADISAEAGLSVGSIYSHFGTRSEIMAAVAADVIPIRVEALLAESDRVRTPAEIVAVVCGRADDEPLPRRILLQIWSEATTDPDLHAIYASAVGALSNACRAAATPWARAKGRPIDAVTRGIVTAIQAHTLRTALGEDLTSDRIIAEALAAFGDEMTTA
ncbi:MULTISPECIES: TetR/AcrR family transcriptional regulator [unclassified Microbacterium]|uniref:TetR/AcrR family transcriptional regulator n=1 Tax=unclassified Microbacterium TaxID=2609290 RepID=UPI0015A03F16|nr:MULTISPECIES: TetR family transcriptional regulator [unclassified Microbacterium]